MTIKRISNAADGGPANDDSSTAIFSPDGAEILFESTASNIVAGNTNTHNNLYLQNLTTGLTTRISATADGTPGNGSSGTATFSPDGQSVLFFSNANNLVAGDNNGADDSFIKNLQTGAVTLISRAVDGTQGNGSTDPEGFSPDGSKVLFASNATNLVPGTDTNGSFDIFLKDLASGAVSRISTATDGAEANSGSFYASFSPDGRNVAFFSAASNLVTGDTNGQADLFIKNLDTGATTRVSTSSSGAQGNQGVSAGFAFSPDGRSLAFTSSASNLVAGDTNGVPDVFLKNLTTGVVQRVSTAADGSQGDGISEDPHFSPDGTKLLFSSGARNLVPGDTNGVEDYFVKDLVSGAITRGPIPNGGGQGDDESFGAAFSPDGKTIAFSSYATNLVPGDTNGDFDVFTTDVVCFCEGTRIATSRGERAVEDLAIGDLVVTAAGQVRPIRWLGRRSYSGRFASRNSSVLPVCFKAGSLADGVPARDLWVSPKHAMFLDGVLVPAEHLVNGISVTKAKRVDRLDYHHVELDSHDVLLAEGAPSESFVDDGGRHIFHNAHEHAAMYPDAARAGAVYCAPRIDQGLQLEATRQRIAARAKIGGAEPTAQAG